MLEQRRQGVRVLWWRNFIFFFFLFRKNVFRISPSRKHKRRICVARVSVLPYFFFLSLIRSRLSSVNGALKWFRHSAICPFFGEHEREKRAVRCGVIVDGRMVGDGDGDTEKSIIKSSQWPNDTRTHQSYSTWIKQHFYHKFNPFRLLNSTPCSNTQSNAQFAKTRT